MKRKTYTTFAAVHIGSEMLSMEIVEYRSLNKYKVIEQCNHRIRLGEETFKNKIIPVNMVNELCEILQGFTELMRSYGVEECKVEATTAVREAKNRVFVLDQIKIKTGLDVEVIEMPQEIYTKYVSIHQSLKDASINANNGGILMTDISSGGLGLTLVEGDKITYQENFHIGIIRIKESFSRNQRNDAHFNKALVQFLSSTMGPVSASIADRSIKYLVLSGAETELILNMLGLDATKKVERISAAEFKSFFTKVRKLNLPQLIEVYKIPEAAAELVLPTILLYEQLLDLAPAQEVIIAADRFIDGMVMHHIAHRKDPAYSAALDQELMSLIHHIGSDFGYDYNHVTQVERLAVRIFDKIGKKYGMDEHCKLLVRAASVLHDIGKFVSMRSHSLYSYQLIMATDLLGFSDDDKKIIALASYYHAHNVFEEADASSPKPEPHLIAIVAKIASILRLADAMDRSYMQKIKDVKIAFKGQELIISAVSKLDLALEEWTFAGKAKMFEEVYGIKVRLERVEKL